MKKIAFHTLGCKLNFSETSAIARQFGEGYELVDFNSRADYYVINTCTVTANAEKTCRQLARRVRKLNPEARVSMIGCFSQVSPETVAAIEGVDLVLGNEDKFNLKYYLENPRSERHTEIHNLDINKSKNFMPAWSGDDRTRTFFKVQDGCDHFCTYCTIPFARGRSRSAGIAETIKEAEAIAATSSREIILSGVNIGDFGRRNGESFYDLLQALEKVQGIDRIRISSVEPELLTYDIIDLVAASDKFQPHFHIPLQAGNNEVLKAMKRNYTRELYTERVEYIRQRLPHACIAADVITGFPSETHELFMDSYQYLRKLPVSYLHVFTYSRREGTYALKLPNMVKEGEKKKRSEMLHILSEAKKRVFYEQNKGRTAHVLFEAAEQNGRMGGWTGNYIRVSAPYRPEWVNTIREVKLDKLNEAGEYTID